jgi:hypothetical protein
VRLRAFREGEKIPDGARYVRSELREVPGSEFERVGPGSGLLGFLGITERVYTMLKRERVSIYEVADGD